MFWAFLLGVTLAAGLDKLGALSVWVVVLPGAVKLAAVLFCALAAFAIWRVVRKR